MNRDIDVAVNVDQATLAELVEDPLVGLVMKSDGIDRNSIEQLFDRIARQRPRKFRAFPE